MCLKMPNSVQASAATGGEGIGTRFARPQFGTRRLLEHSQPAGMVQIVSAACYLLLLRAPTTWTRAICGVHAGAVATL